jgi:hypothetical protein
MNKNSANKNPNKVDLYTLLNVSRNADRDTIVYFFEIEKSL